MKKIKVLKAFPINKIGWLKVGQEIELENSIADYCVKSMKSAEYVEVKTKKTKKKSK
jgi:hypothetical protein